MLLVYAPSDESNPGASPRDVRQSTVPAEPEIIEEILSVVYLPLVD